MENELLVTPVPGAVKMDDHFEIQVRCPGDAAWTEVPLYAVQVDMHDVRQAACAIFDFEGAVEVCIRPRCRGCTVRWCGRCPKESARLPMAAKSASACASLLT